MARSNLLIYLLRRDLRVSDNPILHHLATNKDHGFTHLLPVYVFPHHQIEISGFLKEGETSPYPQALSQVAKFWRCGPHRAKFIAEAVWDVKKSLEDLNSGVLLRVGSVQDVLGQLIPALKEQQHDVGAVWMTEEKSYEEKQEQDSAASVCAEAGVAFKLWADTKYFVDDHDHGLEKPGDLPDVFTNYRKSQEPLRERPRPVLPRPDVSTLPPYPDPSVIPPQHDPFIVASSLDDLRERLLKPVKNPFENPPPFPAEARSAHPFQGGESNARKRLTHLIRSGAMTAYKETRNGLIGPDFSSKLSAYLALGCVSARQVHDEMLKFENGTESAYESAKGYGQGENDGTRGVRFELLWRDYMRLCTIKFGPKLFRLEGFRQGPVYNSKWLTADRATARRQQNPSADKVDAILRRLWAGTTGMGFIDASQRELLHTGYTSNRARQNVASFLSKHLQIDWRYGAEWYEMMLVDYDVSSNWSNWQYVAGVGNDPRGDARIFNPVKQAFDYDKDGMYVRTWVPEVSGLEKLENVFQPWTASITDLEACGLLGNIAVTNPIKRIEFMVDKKPRQPRKPSAKKRGQGRGGGRRGGGGGGGGGGGNEPRNNTHSGGRNGHDQGHANDPGSFSGFGASNGWNGNFQNVQTYSMHQEHQQPPMSNVGEYSGTYNAHVGPQAFHQQGIPHNNMYPQPGFDSQPWFYKNGNSNGYKSSSRGGANGGNRGRRGGRGGHGFANQGQEAHGHHYESFGPPPGYYPPYNGRDI